MLLTNGISPFDPGVFAIFDAAPEPVWLSHPDGRIAFVNRAGLALLNISEERILENGWMDLVPPDEIEETIAQVAHTLQTGEPFDHEGRLLSDDGTYKWTRSRACALRDAEGNIVAFIGHIIDIDKYMRAEQTARIAEARLRRIIDAPLIGFVRSTSERVILDCNDAFCRMLGYTREELIGKDVLRDLTPPEFVAAGEDAAVEVQHTGTMTPLRKSYLHKNGTTVPVLAAGAVDPERPDEVNGYVVDLSSEHALRTAFERMSELNETLIDSMPMMFWVADNSGKVQFFNRWFYDYTGLTPSDTIENAAFWSVIHPEDREGAP